MKVEPRGKFGGVKIHLDPEEAKVLIQAETVDMGYQPGPNPTVIPTWKLALKMGKKIKDLLQEDPSLLQDRTPEQVIAILAKESEKAALQLQQAKAGLDISKVDPAKLQAALLKHVPVKDPWKGVKIGD